MRERRFYFRELLEGEWTNPQVKSEYLVTDPELKKRLYIIAGETGFLKREITDRHIDILLHGEKDQPWPGPEDILEMRGKEQPDVWEEWASNLAKVLKTGPEHGRHLRQLFLSIPCNPRRKP